MSARRGLGRGLDALIRPAEGDVRSLPLDQLEPNRRQPRREFRDESLAELAASIRTQGLVQPIVVTPTGEGYSIVAGERRWRAARMAGLQHVPVVVRKVAGDRELLELALVENLQRSDLNPIEEAQAYQSLKEEFGLSQEEIAARVGKARPTVANSLRLLKLPLAVQEHLRQGRLAAGQARPLLSLKSALEQETLADRAVGQNLSARELEELTSAAPKRARRRNAEPAETEVHAAAAAETLTRRLQTRVEIHRRGKGGMLRVHFHSEEELIRLYDLLMSAGSGG